MNDGDTWLSAAATLARVEAKMGNHQARLAIAGRAHNGLIRTWAERFLQDQHVFDEAELPAEFWWATGHAALEQNWATGDFSTWIDQRAHWQAFGVRFLEADVDRMLPASDAVKPSDIDTATENTGLAESWLAARDAVTRIMAATRQDELKSLYAIIAYVKTGHIKSRAMSIRKTVADRYTKTENEQRNIAVPPWFWEKCTANGSSVLNWKSGVFSGKGYINGKSVSATLTGVQFEANDLDILAPKPLLPVAQYPGGVTWVDREYDPAFSADAPEAAAAPVTQKGGRPAADWWDDLWVEMCRQLYVGDLKPKMQADIEKAMQDWLASQGGAAAVSTIRPRARKLWIMVEDEDRK